jgi:hypothetical protein
MRSHSRLSIVAALGLALATAGASATTINFDDQVIGGVIQAEPGNLYAASGITFSSGNMSPDLNAAIAVGSVFTLTGIQNEFVIINNANAVSGPNFAGARSLGLQDTLMALSGPITSLSLHSDDTAESGQIIRLLALRATGNADEYEVLAFDEKVDSAVAEPGNLLSVSLAAGFSFALFQVTTEQEGFDDVTFQLRAAPEPASALLVAIGLAGLAGLRRRRVHGAGTA